MSVKSVALEKKGSEFCENILYPLKGYEVIRRINTKQEQEIYGDVVLKIKNKEYFIDEKTASYFHDNMVVELIQDVPSQNMGWFYKLKKCDGIIYIYFNNEIPKIVYAVHFKKLFPYINENITKFETLKKLNNGNPACGITNKEYGCTVNFYYPWNWLCRDGIAEIIYESEDEAC
jgi:hypothetical protein